MKASVYSIVLQQGQLEGAEGGSEMGDVTVTGAGNETVS
jgi:hypothetical protein